ncbi:hypothetical protein AGOR_G00221070 [Albula goreensis]|uniref:Uncharacterized protein n=1 Tax=Albula goreensis TaxID=1534307 RepID=A0A8T3CK95_9TELE|nr:hypothetical protein AGOR_G00221070 [Albula goreensis]
MRTERQAPAPLETERRSPECFLPDCARSSSKPTAARVASETPQPPSDRRPQKCRAGLSRLPAPRPALTPAHQRFSTPTPSTAQGGAAKKSEGLLLNDAKHTLQGMAPIRDLVSHSHNQTDLNHSGLGSQYETSPWSSGSPGSDSDGSWARP